MRALSDLREPYAVVLAVVAGVGLLVAQEGPLVALLAAASVLVFRAVAGPVVEHWRPTHPAPPGPLALPHGQSWYHPLTRRESEVALLLAEGLTNREIGERLHSERTVDGHVTERGVDAHVQNIMNKLNVNRRAQISAWVTERRPRSLQQERPSSTH